MPEILEQQLKRMNWEPQAFLVRVKKLFDMYDVYDRVARLDETIAFYLRKSTSGGCRLR